MALPLLFQKSHRFACLSGLVHCAMNFPTLPSQNAALLARWWQNTTSIKGVRTVHALSLYPCLKGRSGVQFLPLLAAPSFEIPVRSQLTEQFVLPDICPHLRVGWHILPLCLRMQINQMPFNTSPSLDAAMLQKQGRDGGKLQARLQ